jgi:hypothetical protein
MDPCEQVRDEEEFARVETSSREQREEGMDPCEQVRDSRKQPPLQDLGSGFIESRSRSRVLMTKN